MEAFNKLPFLSAMTNEVGALNNFAGNDNQKQMIKIITTLHFNFALKDKCCKYEIILGRSFFKFRSEI